MCFNPGLIPMAYLCSSKALGDIFCILPTDTHGTVLPTTLLPGPFQEGKALSQRALSPWLGHSWHPRQVGTERGEGRGGGTHQQHCQQPHDQHSSQLLQLNGVSSAQSC